MAMETVRKSQLPATMETVVNLQTESKTGSEYGIDSYLENSSVEKMQIISPRLGDN